MWQPVPILPAVGSSQTTVETTGRWFGHPDQPSFGWLTVPAGFSGGSGVLVLPPVAYEWFASYRSLRELAERLARLGHAVLRLQYPGTGNAGGTPLETGHLDVWRRSAAEGASELEAVGCRRLTLAGVRLGGALAISEAATLDAERVIAWEPIVTGRRYARELRLRSEEVPAEEAGTSPGTVQLGGTLLGPDLLGEVSGVDVLALRRAPARVLLVDDPGASELAERLRSLGATVDERAAPGSDQALRVPAEDAEVPASILDAAASWLGPARPGRHANGAGTGVRRFARAWRSAQDGEAILPWGKGHVREEVTRVGAAGLVAIRTSPVDCEPSGATLVLLSSGSEPHVGPGRAWVELARELALEGHRTLRVDFRGWGESPDDGHPPGRPYDQHCVTDTVALVGALRGDSDGPLVLAGLCAGAWVALRTVLIEPPDAVVALNPQLYWEPGDPVEALLSDTRRRRTAERAEEKEGARTGRWDELDRRGERNPAGRWLDALRSTPVQLSFVFAEGDDGLEYLENRLHRRVAALERTGNLSVTEISEVDHAMHRAWLRPRVFAAVRDAIDRAVAARA